MKGLSKSRYTAFCQCPKALWLKVFKPAEAKVDETLQARFSEGNKVGDLAMGLFGDYKEAKAKKPDGSLDLAAMASQTRQYMEEGVENICEASFTLDNHYCAVDILRCNGDGWDIYEVKSSTYKGDEHDTAKELLVYSRDIAYQKWLLTQCGVKVNGCYLVRLNKFYTRGKDLDIQQLFHIKNMDEMVENEYVKVTANVSLAQEMNGSFSIKQVLPALYPDDPELDYHNLDGTVHNGGEAMTIYPKIAEMLPDEADAARRSLLEYCKLDTLAMVKIWERLKQRAQD